VKVKIIQLWLGNKILEFVDSHTNDADDECSFSGINIKICNRLKNISSVFMH
jgi:hypothetical protein